MKQLNTVQVILVGHSGEVNKMIQRVVATFPNFRVSSGYSNFFAIIHLITAMIFGGSIIRHLSPKNAMRAKRLFPRTVIFNLTEESVGIEAHQLKEKTFNYRFAELAHAIFVAQGGKVIAIDGPSGCGKGSISTEVAKRLNGFAMDSGLFYRYLAYQLQHVMRLSPGNNADKISEAIETILNSFSYKDILDLKATLRSKEVSSYVSNWAKLDIVREQVFWLQMISVYGAGKQTVVAEGRDMTTCLFKWSIYKFFVNCPLETRARWRAGDLFEDYDAILADLKRRDEEDALRENCPLRCDTVHGVILILNTGPFEETVQFMITEILLAQNCANMVNKTCAITIHGDQGAGKSTQISKLLSQFDWTVVSIGSIMRILATQAGESQEVFAGKIKDNPRIDEQVDQMWKDAVIKGEPFIGDGRLGYFFAPRSFKVYLSCDPKTAAQRAYDDLQKNQQRAASEPCNSVEEMLIKLEDRRTKDTLRYRPFYYTDIFDKSNYDIEIDTTNRSPDEVFELILEAFEAWRGN